MTELLDRSLQTVFPWRQHTHRGRSSNRARLRHLLFLLSRTDKIMLLAQALLLACGCLFIYGAGQEVGGRFAGYWRSQLLWTAIGMVLFLVTCLVDYRVLGRYSWVLYAAAVILLLLLFPAGTVVNNARSWLPIPGTGKSIQPAELAKPATLVFVAWLASRPVFEHSKIHALVAVVLAVSLPVLLIVMQPDFGTALVFLPFAAAIIFVSGLRWRWVMGAVCAVLIMLPLLYPHLRDHQKDRIRVFLEPPANAALAAMYPVLPAAWADHLRQTHNEVFQRSGDSISTDWNAQQSLLAVGSGGLWGKGFMGGTQHVLGFLPRTVAPTDFIFSVIAEETGFAGAATVILLFMGMIVCCLRTALVARDELGAYVSLGVAVILFTHAFINIGMTMQAAPIIGIPLPYVSYGGSFMLSTMLLAGLVQSVYVRRHGNR